MFKGETLYDKLWNCHQVDELENGESLLYIDRHLAHEVTSPQAFEGIANKKRSVRNPQSILATPDHQVPTTQRDLGLEGFSDSLARIQVETLDQNCSKYGIKHYGLDNPNQGVVHVVGPEQGFTLPGTTLVCGDSHTSTHGAFAALAQGIGSSEVEHVFATQCLRQRKSKNLRVSVEGELQPYVTAKDLALFIIGQLGVSGANGHVVEYAGSTTENLSMEARMTLCNMSIEMGARSGLIAYDATTEEYLKNRPNSPSGKYWLTATKFWRTLSSDPHAEFDKEYTFRAENILPQVSWGTKPDQVTSTNGKIPNPAQLTDKQRQTEWESALNYMDLNPDTELAQIKIERVFIGSCTNGRIEDLRLAANTIQNHKVCGSIKEAIVVPGSGRVKAQAEQEGLDKIFKSAGFQWRDPGCSMCNAMNPDTLNPGERCVSTSNRNFEGRQGYKGRTHLANPAVAAATAIKGFICHPSKLTTETEASPKHRTISVKAEEPSYE